jgi:signal transduction histidine kinase
MPEEFKLGTLKALKMSRKTSSESESLLVIRGNQFHQIMLWVTGFLGIGYGILDYAQGNFDQVIMNISVTPIMAVCYWLFKKGFINLSKIFNLVAVTIIISLHSLIQTQATLVLSFFIPIFLSSLILFQGKDRFIGYVLTAIVFAWMVLLLITDVTIGNPISLTRQELKIEWLINLTGSSIVIIMEVIFILILNSSMQNELIEKSKNLDLNNQKLQASLLTKDKLISIISHDIRGPVVMINSGLNMLEDMHNLDDENKQIFDELKKRSNSTVSLINNLLVWSRNQTNQIKFSPTPIKSEKLKSMFEAITEIDSNKNIIIELSIHESAEVIADPNMLEAIIRNLFSNAVKFTPSGGKITVGCKKTSMGMEFFVENSGMGISEDVKKRILEGESFTLLGTEKEIGHGLGLQIVREFVMHHGSTLEIESETSVSTRFYFTIPDLQELSY